MSAMASVGARATCVLWVGSLAAFLCVSVGLSVGCSHRPPGPGLVVGVASSAASAVDEIVDVWANAGGEPVQISSASSSMLARQIERGSPVDVMISADRAWVEYLTDRGLGRAESVCVVAGNGLVLYARADRATAPPGIVQGSDLTGPGEPLLPSMVGRRWTTGDPEHVPLGRYAKEALVTLGWWEALGASLVPAPNARAAVRLVELGEADFGVGYRTDVPGPGWVTRALDGGLHGPIEITAVQMTSAHPGAPGFMAFLQGPEAAAKLRAAGFGLPRPAPAAGEVR